MSAIEISKNITILNEKCIKRRQILHEIDVITNTICNTRSTIKQSEKISCDRITRTLFIEELKGKNEMLKNEYIKVISEINSIIDEINILTN